MANDGTGTLWDEADPADAALLSDGAKQIRDLRIGVRLRNQKEHVADATGTAGGEHLAGSAKTFYGGAAPTKRPDTTTNLDAADSGRLWNDAGVLKYWNGSAWAVPTVVGTGLGLAVLTHQVAIGTGGGSFATGAWNTRVLNTEFDPVAIVTLAANQFTLAAGTYRIRAWATGYRVNAHIARLQNITDGTTALYGSGEVSSNSSNTAASKSVVEGTITLSGAKTFELQHRCETTNSGVNGRGYPALSWGGNEIHATVEIIKIQ